ncbi:MAG TPA: NAD(P)/FAD-dependent oxidoreductase [Chthoniobacterales bacterium]|nr:NAD(P)/FAD-dependent oxidoreductase [Chthoniobacterales bacterium]
MPIEETIDLVIIGAGAAGLGAWRELYSAGLTAVILEARDRIGGRILTDRSTILPVELGAEFVHGRPKAIWSILEKARLKVNECPDTRLVSAEEGLRHCPAYWKIIEKVNKQIDPSRETAYDQFLAAADAFPFEKLVAKSYVEGFNAARAEMISASAVALGDRASAEIDGQRQFRVYGGYGSLVDWLAADLRSDRLYLRTAVREIRWRRGHVEAVADTPSGEATFSATRLIVTVPLGVLQAPPGASGAIQFVPSLPQKEAAVRRLQMGHVVKLMICFSERFWEVHGRFAFVISLDREMPVWWTQEPLTSNVLTGWAGGPAAEKLIDLPPEDLLDRAIQSLVGIFAKPKWWLRERVDTFHYHDWSHDPFSRGAYSYPKIGGLEAAEALAKPVDDTIFFAGEATDFRGANGTVHAALDSGISVAQKIVAAWRRN